MAAEDKNPSSNTSESIPMAGFGRALSRSRFIVVIAVIAVMLVAVTLFLLGSWQALVSLGDAWQAAFKGHSETSQLTVQSLDIVSTMLKAVVFYLVGVGLYSLFIAPLNITVALGVESLADLESKLLSIVVVIMSTTFLEHFIKWQQPLETLEFGVALALVIASLVLFQRCSRSPHEAQKSENPAVQMQAKREMFHGRQEHREIKQDDVAAASNADDESDEGEQSGSIA